MRNKSEHIDEKILFRFLLGEANPEETKHVEDWLQLSKENKNVLNDYETIWLETGKLTPKPVAVDPFSAWQKMSDRIDKFEKEKSLNKTKVISLRSRLVWITASAAAVLIIFFAIQQLFFNPETIKDIQFASAEKILYDTLPDGSQIALNLNSKITYPEKFTNNERRVKLEGEAFFDVKHNKEKPFVIEAGNAFVKVLGTSFDIKLINNQPEVIVTQGLVKLFTVDANTNDTLSLLLKAGEKGVISKKDNKPVLEEQKIPDAIFWMKKTLIFHDTDLKKVFTLLENFYNIEIKVSDKEIYNLRLSTTFSNNSIQEVLKVIAITFELKYTKEKNTFTIKKDDSKKNNK